MPQAIKWAGTEESFHVFEDAIKRISAATPEMLDRKKAYDDEWDTGGEDDTPRHPLLSMDGDLALVTVDGVLVPGAAGWWGQLFGLVGYDDIRNAIVTGMEAGAKETVVHIQSPGGAVIGVGALTDFIKEANKEVPITFYSDTFVASAGVWTSVSTGRFLAGQHAEVGSIGVVMVNTELSKMFAEMGVNQTVFRTSELKGIGMAPGEALSKAQRDELQRSVDDSGDRFIQHVASSMKLDESYVRDELATGQMWYADQALEKGLITGVTTFDKLLVAIQNRLNQNNANVATPTGRQTQNSFRAEASMAKKILKQKLTPEEAVALAASGLVAEEDMEDGDGGDQGLPLKQKPIKDPGVKEEKCDPDAEDGEEEDKKGKSKKDDKDGDETASVSVIMKMVQASNTQLIAANVELTKVQGELAVAKSMVETMAANETALKAIVVQAIQHGQVSMGQSPSDTEGLMALGATVLVGQHAAIHSQLVKKYGGGGRITVAVDESADEESAKASSHAEYVQDILQRCSTIGAK